MDDSWIEPAPAATDTEHWDYCNTMTLAVYSLAQAAATFPDGHPTSAAPLPPLARSCMGAVLCPDTVREHCQKSVPARGDQPWYLDLIFPTTMQRG